MRIVKWAVVILLLLGGINGVAKKRIYSQVERLTAECASQCLADYENHPGCEGYCSCVTGELKDRHSNPWRLAARLGEIDRRHEEGVEQSAETERLFQYCVDTQISSLQR